MSHDDQAESGVGAELVGGPGLLAGGGGIEDRRVDHGVAQAVVHGIGDPEADRRMEGAEQRDRGPVAGHPLEQAGTPVSFGDSIAMDGQHPAAGRFEGGGTGMEIDLEVASPELVAPAIVVPAGHDDGHPLAQLAQGGGHGKSRPGYHPLPGEPEIEQVARDEEGVAQGRRSLEKLEKGGLVGRGPGAEVGIADGDESLADHGPKIGASRPRWQARNCVSPLTVKRPLHTPLTVSETRVRVNYSETDQMGVVYHARHIVWLDIARTEHLRLAGYNYRDLEDRNFRLVVTDLRIRYLRPARYDDQIRIRCWVREVASRRVIFGYAVELADDGTLLATAETALICLDHKHELARLPDEVRQALAVTPDPVRL